MNNFVNLPFQQFWSLTESAGLFHDPKSLYFSHALGWHVYADLKLNLDLAAAEDTRNAMKFVDLLEDFTTISDQCASLVDARIIEVQGDRIHFILTADQPHASLAKLLQFSSALTRTIYQELKPKAGDDWRGFSMAADHGPAVLIPSSFGGGSLVSLGNSANQPAKKLGRGVESGHLAIPSNIGAVIPSAKKSGNWIEIDVNTPTEITKTFFDNKLTESMQAVAKTVLKSRESRPFRAFAPSMNPGVSFEKTPLRTRGICLRADLDGFTKAVEEAFKTRRIPELVKQFSEIMRYPIEFGQTHDRQQIELPWAGDCCTVLIYPRPSESVEDMRTTLPISAGRHWHGLAYQRTNQERWRSAMGTAKWALGMACGDQDEGGNGNVIIAELPAAGRSFRVIAGWSARRAKDAQESSGIGAEDTVIPNVDYQNLEEIFKPLFAPVGSLYRFSPYAKLQTASLTATRELSTSSARQTTGIITALPAPRPYGRG